MSSIFKDPKLDSVMKEIFKREFVTPDQLVQLANSLILFLGGANERTDGKLKQAIDDLKSLDEKHSQLGKDVGTGFDGVRKELMKIMTDALTKSSGDLEAKIVALIPDETDLSEIEARIAGIKQISVEDIVNGFPAYGERIRDALELLSGDERLLPSAIQGLQEWMNKADLTMSKGGVRMMGGTAGIQLYVNGAKKGTAKYLNFVAGTNMTISYALANGKNTLTFNASGGGSSASFSIGEVPTGTVDGLNAAFAAGHTPVVGTVAVYLNGTRQQSGSDYTISGATITFANAPLAGSIILIDYQY